MYTNSRSNKIINSCSTTLLSMLLCLSIPLTACQAQAQSNKIDVVSYNIPSGFSAESEGNASARAFTKKYGGGKFAFITLYASTGSFGDANTDFSRRWKQLLAGMAQNKAVPQTVRSNVSGITILNGYSNIVYEGSPAIGLLTTLTVNGRLITIVGVFNDKQGQTDYQAFLDGLDIDDAVVNQKPANIATKPSTPVNNPNTTVSRGGIDSRFFGTWKRSLSSYRQRGGDVYIGGGSGNVYVFESGGTFRDSLLASNKGGKWQVSDNNLKLVYNNGVVEQYRFEFTEFRLFATSKPIPLLRLIKPNDEIRGLYEKASD